MIMPLMNLILALLTTLTRFSNRVSDDEKVTMLDSSSSLLNLH
jgi:hypothetical protein